MSSKITALASIAGASVAVGDLFVLVDVSDTTMAATGTDKSITTSELLTALAALPLAGGTMTGTITSTIGTITSSTPFFSGSATLNASGTTFHMFTLDVTETAAASGSTFFDVKRNGTSALKVATNGLGADVYIGKDCYAAGGFQDSSGNNGYALRWLFGAVPGLNFRATARIGWTSGASYAGTADTGISRNAAGVVEINNGTAGTFRDLKLRDLVSTGAVSIAGTAASSAAGVLSIGAGTRTTIGANGAASALTAAPVGYLDIYIGTTAYQLPYYNRGA